MSAAEIRDEIAALATHYPKPRRTELEEARWLRDYANDLASLTADQVKQACGRFRRSEAIRMASAAQIIAMAKIGEAPVSRNAGPWRTLAADEINGLTVREAERYHRMAAQHVVTSRYGKIVARVGSRDRGVLREDEDYRRMMADEAFHLGESRRLRGVLSERRA